MKISLLTTFMPWGFELIQKHSRKQFICFHLFVYYAQKLKSFVIVSQTIVFIFRKWEHWNCLRRIDGFIEGLIFERKFDSCWSCIKWNVIPTQNGLNWGRYISLFFKYWHPVFICTEKKILPLVLYKYSISDIKFLYPYIF